MWSLIPWQLDNNVSNEAGINTDEHAAETAVGVDFFVGPLLLLKV